MRLEKARFVLGQIAHGMIRPQKEINEAVDTVFKELDKRIWIPVTERLPEETGYYLTSTEYKDVLSDFFCDGKWWTADLYWYNVKAWMPLPEAYQPGVSE